MVKSNNSFMNIQQGTLYFQSDVNSAYFAGFAWFWRCNPNPARLITHSLRRHQGAAFDHECHMRLRPQQGDQLHGTRPDGSLPTGQVQCRVGRQAPVDPALLHALLRGWYRTPAGFAPPLKECVASLGSCCLALTVYQLRCICVMLHVL